MNEKLKLRITPRARAIYAQLKAETDDTKIAALQCALHSAVGLHPWDDILPSEVVAYLDTTLRTAIRSY